MYLKAEIRESRLFRRRLTGEVIGHIIICGGARCVLFTQKRAQTDCVHIKGKTFNSFFGRGRG